MNACSFLVDGNLCGLIQLMAMGFQCTNLPLCHSKVGILSMLSVKINCNACKLQLIFSTQSVRHCEHALNMAPEPQYKMAPCNP